MLAHGKIPGSRMAHKVYHWVDPDGRPTSAPPDPFEIQDSSRCGEYKIMNEADERKVIIPRLRVGMGKRAWYTVCNIITRLTHFHIGGVTTRRCSSFKWCADRQLLELAISVQNSCHHRSVHKFVELEKIWCMRK